MTSILFRGGYEDLSDFEEDKMDEILRDVVGDDSDSDSESTSSGTSSGTSSEGPPNNIFVEDEQSDSEGYSTPPLFVRDSDSDGESELGESIGLFVADSEVEMGGGAPNCSMENLLEKC